ncbi:MAG TPA: hypothetical protein VK473_14615 [Terriglobales bacterium]|nr:hypothetical protein [Terriglobales bacterium]
MKRAFILAELHGGLWHTTHPDRFKQILASGAILPDPGFSNWKATGGEDCCPYARKLGGISLFDFEQFDPESYQQKYPLSSWDTFVPCLEKWSSAVWIEIDREKVEPNLISRFNLVDKWKSDEAYKHNFMPEIEAVHLGALPRTAFKRAFLVCKEDNEFHPLAL